MNEELFLAAISWRNGASDITIYRLIRAASRDQAKRKAEAWHAETFPAREVDYLRIDVFETIT